MKVNENYFGEVVKKKQQKSNQSTNDQKTVDLITSLDENTVLTNNVSMKTKKLK